MRNFYLASTLFLLGAFASAQVQINPLPSRVFGNSTLRIPLVSTAPNLVEGRELSGPQSVALDTTVTPPILYVADTGNNRVLAWRNTAGLTRGDRADRVVGQRDFVSTLGQGPGSGTGGLQSGLSVPTAVAVDRQGNLYVADSGNNRILRYPRPFDQPGTLQPVDLVIGQRNVSTGTSPNQGLPNPSEKTLFFSTSGALYVVAMAFDAQGNLWVVDAGNNRVLRFPVAQLAANTAEPAADRVLGQTDFVSRVAAQSTQQQPNGQLARNGLVIPGGIAIDGNGNIYVSDAFSRVLFFSPPFTNGMNASRILGVLVRQPDQPAPTYPNNIALGAPVNPQATAFVPPEGLFIVNNSLWVCDTPNHRLVRYAPPAQWPAETAAVPSPTMQTVYGQIDFLSGRPNRSLFEPTSGSFSNPVAAAASGNEVYVADSGNHRVLALPVAGDTFGGASKLVGQQEFNQFAVNLIEGREVFFSAGNVATSGVAIDRKSDPPRLYISDGLNNRVLGFRDARNVRPGDRADIVIGQTDFFRSVTNSPVGDPNQLSDSGLFNPNGVAVDDNGDLWVADTGNSRVLRFASPFAQTVQRANLVLGQLNFTSKITDASSQTMRSPLGIAVFFDGSVAVSDATFNRVLFFQRPAGGDFRNGQEANKVFGQPDFVTVTPGNTATRMNSPRAIASDTDDRMYVCDTGNNRVHVYTRAPAAGADPAPAVTLTGFSSPQGITVSRVSGEIWVASTGGQEVRRFPEFTRLILNPDLVLSRLSVPAPLSLVLDDNENPIIAEAVNRISFYYASLTFQNAASFSSTRLAPGQLAYLYRLGRTLDTPTRPIQATPWPKTLGDYQVTVDGVSAPIFQLVPGRIDFQVPRGTRTSGNAEVQILRSNGQIIAVGQIPMDRASPALFTASQTGSGQLAALNQDNTVNTPLNRLPRGQVIQLFGTGAGVGQSGLTAGYPEDGLPAPGAVPIPENAGFLKAFVNGFDARVQYTGLAPGFVGLWQVNVLVDNLVPPGANITVLLLLYDIPSNDGPGSPPIRLQTTISVQ